MKTTIKIIAIVIMFYVVVRVISRSDTSLPQYDTSAIIASNIEVSYIDAQQINNNYWRVTVRFANNSNYSIRKLTAKFEIYNYGQLMGSFNRDVVNNNYLIAPKAPYDYNVYFQSPDYPRLQTKIIFASD